MDAVGPVYRAPVVPLQLNDRYALLGIFMGCYFLFFGGSGSAVAAARYGLDQPTRYGFLTPAERLILTGAGAALAGYLLVAVMWDPVGAGTRRNGRLAGSCWSG